MINYSDITAHLALLYIYTRMMKLVGLNWIAWVLKVKMLEHFLYLDDHETYLVLKGSRYFFVRTRDLS